MVLVEVPGILEEVLSDLKKDRGVHKYIQVVLDVVQIVETDILVLEELVLVNLRWFLKKFIFVIEEGSPWSMSRRKM